MKVNKECVITNEQVCECIRCGVWRHKTGGKVLSHDAFYRWWRNDASYRGWRHDARRDVSINEWILSEALSNITYICILVIHGLFSFTYWTYAAFWSRKTIRRQCVGEWCEEEWEWVINSPIFPHPLPDAFLRVRAL